MKTIKSRQDFEHVFSQGRRFNHPLIRMTICESVGEGDSGRVAFVGAKRLGCAVVRNRSKRVMREAARSCGFPVAGYDIILFATPKTRVLAAGDGQGIAFAYETRRRCRGGAMSNHVLRRVAIAPIRIYQQVISPLLPDACIYYPTCSQYAVQAIEKYGVLRGCWLAVRRIARCNPLHVGGYDPVP